jgi:hypothetical protein
MEHINTVKCRVTGCQGRRYIAPLWFKKLRTFRFETSVSKAIHFATCPYKVGLVTKAKYCGPDATENSISSFIFDEFAARKEKPLLSIMSGIKRKSHAF